MFILLSDAPYENVDRITNEAIDVTSVTSDKNRFSFFYDPPELMSESEVKQDIFPLIRVIE